jgi:hypothetical protein
MITCACGAKWTGTGRTHCAAPGCHRLFSGLTAFDAHRKGGECLLPGDAGLVKREDGVWAFPSDPDAPPWWEGRQ